MFCEKLSVQGILPERALLRLKREGICVKNAKKVKKNQILFRVSAKESRKVFAIYPKVCYNGYEQSSYTVTRIGAELPLRLFRTLKKRWGLLLGGALCLPLAFYADGFVLSVSVEGTEGYKREVFQALEEGGITPFSRFNDSRVDGICAKILALDGVGFCSVKKEGTTVTVEIVRQPFQKPNVVAGGLVSSRSGQIKSLAVLRGTPLKKKGDAVAAGELLVADYLLAGGEGTEKIPTAVIARACLTCTYEGVIDAGDEETAFAEAYLQIALSTRGEIISRSVTETEEGYLVKIDYEEIVTINF